MLGVATSPTGHGLLEFELISAARELDGGRGALLPYLPWSGRLREFSKSKSNGSGTLTKSGKSSVEHWIALSISPALGCSFLSGSLLSRSPMRTTVSGSPSREWVGHYMVCRGGNEAQFHGS